MRIRIGRVLLALVVLGLFALSPALASGDSTHRFIKHVPLPVNGAQLMGVDSQGNIILFAEGAIRKFNPNGEPVDFSALGTNVIDGTGSGNCPATPSDCDQTPLNHIGEPPSENGVFSFADMNQSTSGPTAGYMYVSATQPSEEGKVRAQIYAFDSTGRYRGQIDTSQPTPLQSFEDLPTFLSVSPSGTIVLTYNNPFNGFGDSYHADKYQPVNADPADDAFVGQLRKDIFGRGLLGGGFALGTIADDDVVYVGRGGLVFGPEGFHPTWELYDAAAFGQPEGDSVPVNLDPNGCECDSSGPWGDGGRTEFGGFIEYVSIDPFTHHAYLGGGGPEIEEWATPTEQVGFFGDAETIGGGQLAFDTSGVASTRGRIYASRGSSLSVFSPPVPLPTVEDLQAIVGHNNATILATVNLDHGPKVNSCQIQWGEEYPEQPVSYSNSAPCSPATPYTSELTQISTNISNLNTEVNYAARIVVKTNNGTNRSHSITIRPPAVLAVKTDPAANVTRTTAQLGGSLDPDGMATTYWFEWGIDTTYRQATAKASAGEGTGVEQVTPVEITNLQPGRRYHFRLVASNSLGESRGNDQSFVAASAPAISGVTPSDVAETSATLSALINPGGYQTNYRFEYGRSSDYGSSEPQGGGTIEGTDPQPVSVHLSGLEPGVEYHFRVVATNTWGTEASDDATFTFFPSNCPNAYTRQLTRAAYLPDCRAYELVSPRNAGGIELYPGDLTVDYIFYIFLANRYPYLPTKAQNLGTATSPGRFTFLGLSGALPGTNPPNSLIDTYTATRTGNGWVSHYWGLQGNESIGAGGAECNEQMDVCIDYRVPEILLETDPNFKGSAAPYVWDWEGNSLGRWPTNLGVVKNGEEFIGDDKPSPNFRHYVFSSNNVKFTTDGVLKQPGSTYDNDIEEATVTKVSVLPGGGNIPAGVGSGEGEEFMRIPAVSRDGSHILMTTHAEGDPATVNLYMRVDDAVSYAIAEGKFGIHLIGMTEDGSKVLFASRDRVTADDTDASEDIFQWEEATNEITRISQGNGAGDTNSCQPPEPLFLCPAAPLKTERPDSDDAIASRSGDVYFISPEQLDPNSPGVLNEKNLYVYRHGAVKYVATLDPKTTIDRIQISPDGSHVAFLTAARLTSYDNEGWREMYTYNPENGVVRCVSCIPDGRPPQILRPPEDPFSGQNGRQNPSKDVMASQSGRFMSDDGRTAFATSDALVENDTNGLVDVYEFVGGRPQLITSGTASTDLLTGNRFYPGEYTGLEAMSRDGVDIYFSTYDTLAPEEDENGQFLKFYDARTNGGFPPPPAQLPCVAADECHGEENARPAGAVIGTSARLGSESTPKKAKHKRHGKKRGKPRHRKHHRRGGHRNG
jgi:hypothetical protein